MRYENERLEWRRENRERKKSREGDDMRSVVREGEGEREREEKNKNKIE